MRIAAAAFLLVGLCACASAPVATREDYTAAPREAACPPGDRNDWRLAKDARPAETYLWVVLEPQAFRAKCNPEGLSPALQFGLFDPIGKEPYSPRGGAGIPACTVREGRSLAITYALVPRAYSSEKTRVHERCHGEGWEHDTPREMRWGN